MHGGIPSRCKSPNRILTFVRPHVLFGLLLLLGACSSVQEPLPPVREGIGGAALIRGAVLTENHDITVATASARSSIDTQNARPVEASGTAPGYAPNQVLVQYKSGAQSGLGALSADAGLRLIRADRYARTAIIEPEPGESLTEAIARLKLDPSVAQVTPNYYVHPTGLPNDPYLTQQWALASTGVPVAWSADSSSAEPITVAVIDTGFDIYHEDLDGRFLPGYDFCANADCSATDVDPRNGTSANWHGTHVAGVLGAHRDNNLGISGVADGGTVRILPVKIFNDDGGGASTDVLIKGLRWAAGLPVEGAPYNRYPARIINLSLAGDFPSETLQVVLDEVREAGALVVASTGNSGVDRVMSPAAAEGVVAVGSINRNFRRSCFSNHGVGPNGPGGVDILAPGGEADGAVVSCGIERSGVEGLMSAIPENRYGNAIGTSMAAPMVSGAAALLLSRYPSLTVDELEERLLASAYFDPDYMNVSEYGAGVLRADRALGFAGPGDSVRVELTPEEEGEVFTTMVSLELTEASSNYSIEGIPAGRYQLSAEDPENGLIYSQQSVALASGEERLENITLQARP